MSSKTGSYKCWQNQHFLSVSLGQKMYETFDADEIWIETIGRGLFLFVREV